MTKPTHGGRRPNQTGRPAKHPDEKRIKVAITLPPDLHKKTAGSRSKYIEHALNRYFETDPKVLLAESAALCAKMGKYDLANRINGLIRELITNPAP